MFKVFGKNSYNIALRSFRMNKNWFLIIMLFILSATLGVVSGIYFFRTENQNIARAEVPEVTTGESEMVLRHEETPSPTEEVYVFKNEQYVVTLSDTKILIYKIAHDGSMQTVEEKPIDTGSLPREDYAKLYSGIIVETLDAAKEIVEDYIS